MNLHTSRLIRALCVFALPVFAFAQAAPKSGSAEEAAKKKIPVEEKQPADDAAKAVQLDTFEVTGTRIRTLGQEQGALPVFSVPQVELERRGVTRLADIRQAIPQLAAAVGFNDNLTNSGTSRAQTVSTSFNLRGIGGNSTLVLVDGRRIPHTGQEAPGGAGGREDFSVDGIPVSAIERIDILPQGAGAVYGAEAIAGVVNIILKKNYTGTEMRVTYDNTFKTDVAQTTIDLTSGYRAGKLSTFLTLSYEKQNGMKGSDRWWTSTYDYRKFGSTSTSFLSSPSGGAGTLSTAFYPFSSTGANLPGLTTYVVGVPANSNGSTAANGAYTTTLPEVYDAAPLAYQIDPAKRLSAVFKADYRFNAWADLYVEARASRFENDFTGTPLTLTTQLPVGAVGNPFSVPVYLSKVFYDLPLPHTISRQDNRALTLGLRGDLPLEWRYDASFAFSRNIVSDDAIVAGSFNFTLLSAAINNADPALRPLLAYDSSRLTDPNPAGRLAALLPVADHKDTTDFTQWSLYTDGSVWHGWAGDWKAAVGGELSREKVKFWREPSPATPTYVLTKPFARDMQAAFGEISIPLISEKQGVPLVHRIEIGGAIRATDYSDAGGVNTPSYRVLYKPASWLSLRAARAEGFKPVRLYDLLAPVSNFTTTLTASRNITDPRRGNELVVGTFPYISGGNPTLKPEESVSKNAGVVIDVPGKWFQGLSFSADYYQFTYDDRSGSPSLQVLLNYFPERITRGTPSAADAALGYAGPLVSYDASNINLAKVYTKGWDYRLAYSRTFAFGDLSISLALTDPNVIWTQSTPLAAPSSTFGHQPRRYSASAFWARGAWDAGLVVDHQATYFINGLTSTPYPAVTEYSPQVSYNFGKDPRFGASAADWWARSLSGSKITVTIKNALDSDAELIAGTPRFAGDPRLRRYILTFAKKF